jgi:superfamily II DNA or RNA helicase
MQTAPLPAPGSVVLIRQRRWRVERVRRSRGVVRLDVVNRGGRLTFLAPFDRPAVLAGGERTRFVGRSQAIARLGALIAASPGWREVASAIGADVTILPHQLEPALAMLAGQRRILLADEVGLGKTIQAGLAIVEIVRREPAARVLVTTPPSLRDQWRDELTRRFGIDVIVADRPHLEALSDAGAFGASPWSKRGVWLASFDFLKQPHIATGLPAEFWDLVVIDEAHDACGQSARHQACAAVAARGRRVLLVTATPHSGDNARFDRLLALGAVQGADPGITVFRRTRADLGIVDTRRSRWCRVPPRREDAAVLDALLAFERWVLGGADGHRDAALLLLSMFRKRALSTFGALRLSLARRLSWLDLIDGADSDWIQPSLWLEDADEDPAEPAAIRNDIGVPPSHERSWLRRLHELAAEPARRESKVRRIGGLVRRAREPVVVFTEFRESLEVVSRHLDAGDTALLHGGLGPAERRIALDRFRDGGASVLVATDVGGQGLNLQERARWVVNLDVPWNPARLEQRAGRVDRIGQSRPVHVTTMLWRHAAEAAVLTSVARRVLAARHSLGADVLMASVPDERAVSAAVLEGGECDGGSGGARVPVCRRWRRAAAVAARRLAWRRQLAAAWRGDAPSATVRMTGRPRLDPPGEPMSVVLVFQVPLTDGLGDVLEQCVVPVVVGRKASGRDLLPEAVEHARRLAAARAAPRVRRLARLVAARTGAAARVEAALTRELRDALTPGEWQAGLFDRREARAEDAAARDVFELDRATADRLADAALAADVRAGRPRLVFVAGGRS